jgi:hypothetical protein
VSDSVQTGLVPALLALELMAAASLILNYHPQLGWKMVAGLTLTFLVAQTYGVFWKGMTHCSCFGLLVRLRPSQSMLLDAGLLAVSLVAADLLKRDPGQNRSGIGGTPYVTEERRRARQALWDMLALAAVASAALVTVPHIAAGRVTSAVTALRPTYDFGTVHEGQAIRHSFELENRSKRWVKIVKIDRSCGCTRANPISTYMSPLGRDQIVVEVRPTTIGHFQSDLWVSTNERKEVSPIRLSLLGTVLRQ